MPVNGVADAITEGDGERVVRCWWYFLPVFKASNSTSSSLPLPAPVRPVSMAINQPIWGRFVNVRGLP